MTVERLISEGVLERVEPDPDAAQAARDEARRHLASAREIAASDPNGAYQLAYDAARKAIVGHMREAGVRVRQGEGGHAKTAHYARAEIDDSLGRQFDGMRRQRNRSEYGVAHFERVEVQRAIEVAEELLSAAERN